MFDPVKPTALLIFLLSLSSAAAQQTASGVIYGAVVGSDGSPARGMRLTASPLGAALATRLPETRSDQSGNYRFDKIPWWGEYTVYADDPDAGYSIFSTGPAGPGAPPEAIISPEHPEAKLDLRLPPKAGFLRVHLTDQTGAVIPAMNVTVMSSRTPSLMIFSESCGSDAAVLIPPDKDLVIHITSPGFREWDESAAKGKAIRMPPGSQVELYVQLAPE
jgi:hypothetical protein